MSLFLLQLATCYHEVLGLHRTQAGILATVSQRSWFFQEPWMILLLQDSSPVISKDPKKPRLFVSVENRNYTKHL